MSKNILYILLIILTVAVASWFLRGNINEGQVDVGVEDFSGEVVLSIDEVAKHSSKNDCWIVLHGKVYNATPFVGDHPGGLAILQGCGRDGSDLYEKKPGTGRAHSDQANMLKEEFLLGDLVVE